MVHDMWEVPIAFFKTADMYGSPIEKIEIIEKTYHYIAEILQKFSSRKESPGADDSTPLFCYIILRAMP